MAAFFGVLTYFISAPFWSQDVDDAHGCGLHKPRVVDVRPNLNAGRSKCVWITAEGRALRDKTIAGTSSECKTMAQKFDMARLAEIQPVWSGMRIFLDNHHNAELPCDHPVER